jgi:hypothetical protein
MTSSLIMNTSYLAQHDNAAGAHHRLGDEGRHRVRAFLDDHRVEFGGEPARERLLALAVVGVAVMVRAAGVQKARQRQVEVAMIAGEAGERGRGDGDAVIGLDAADDLLLVRPAERIVEIPDKLDLGVVRLRSGIAEKNFRDRHRRDLLELLRQFDRRIVALAREQMRERELAHLRRGCFDEFLVAVAERGAPQPRHALDIGLAGGVVDEDPLSALDDERPGLAQSRQIDVRVHQGLNVAGSEIAQRRH